MNTDDFHQIIAHLFYLSQYPMWRSHTWCFKTKVAVRVLSWKNLADLGAWTALMTREMVNEKNMCLHPNAARMEPQNWFFSERWELPGVIYLQGSCCQFFAKIYWTTTTAIGISGPSKAADGKLRRFKLTTRDPNEVPKRPHKVPHGRGFRGALQVVHNLSQRWANWQALVILW